MVTNLGGDVRHMAILLAQKRFAAGSDGWAGKIAECQRELLQLPGPALAEWLMSRLGTEFKLLECLQEDVPLTQQRQWVHAMPHS